MLVIFLLIYAVKSEFGPQALISCTFCMTGKWSESARGKDFAGINKLI